MVSIIIITYNRANFLKRAIDGVINQTVKDWELVIIDDGSTDDTYQLIRSYKDARIRYFKINHVGNISRLRNIGIEKSKGEYIAFLDSDDEWSRDKVEKQLNSIGFYEDAMYSFSDVNVIENGIVKHSGSFPGKRTIYGIISDDYLMDRLVLFPSALLVNRICFNTIGLFDEDLNAGDHDLMARLTISFKGILLKDKLVNINRHGNNHSEENKLKPLEDYLYTIDKLKEQHLISTNFHRRCKSRILYKKAIYLSRYHRIDEARSTFIDSFFVMPFNLKGLIKYFLLKKYKSY